MKIPKPMKYFLTALVIVIAAFVVIVVITVAPTLERIGWL